MCLDDNGDLDWLACEVDGCRVTWEPAAPGHLNILDKAIAEGAKIVATFPESERDAWKVALREKHKAALADLGLFRNSVTTAIKPERQIR